MTTKHDPWIEASDVIPMFPTFVWKISLRTELRDALDSTILATIGSMRRDLPELAPGQGWQSESSLHERTEFVEFISCVGHVARTILGFLRIDEAIDVTGCWATVLARGGSHKVHSHPNNFLSGVYYVRVHPGADTINFHDPRSQSRIIRPPVWELTSGNTDQVVVTVLNGSLLMFPSYLEHSVDANTGDEERISVSFNLMFPSFAKDLSKPLW